MLESCRNAKALCAGKETKVVKEYVYESTPLGCVWQSLTKVLGMLDLRIH